MAKPADVGRRRTALGRGLDALLPMDEPTAPTFTEGPVTYSKAELLIPNPHQPRRKFSEDALNELADSIRRLGLLQPLIVRPADDGRYEIVAGERRWRAALIAGYDSLPVSIRELTDSEALEISLIENLQREDLNPIDTAEAYDVLVQKFSYTHEALAKRIGKDRSAVTNQLRLLKLPEPIRDALRDGSLSMGHARALLAVESLPEQLRLAKKTVVEQLSVRELERIIQQMKAGRAGADAQSPKPRGPLDQARETLERRLSSHLETRTVIHKKDNGSGRLDIYFHSVEDLTRLLDVMGYKEDFS